MFTRHLISTIRNSEQHNPVYHFTDNKNIQSIRERGLLSKAQMRLLGVRPEAPGGNVDSWKADARKGIFNYVSLCFTLKHPMCHIAKGDGRLTNPKYIGVNPDVLLLEGVMFCNGVANRTEARYVPINDAEALFDLEVIYERTNWRDDAVKVRLNTARKYELLVPTHVPRKYLEKLWNA